MRQLGFIILIGISIASCSQVKYSGIYSYPGLQDSFALMTDSTFVYSFRSGNLQAHSTGMWSIGNSKTGKLVLNSTLRTDRLPLSVFEEVVPNTTNNVKLILSSYFSKEKDTVLWTSIILNDSLEQEVKDGTIEYPAPTLKSFKVRFNFNNYLDLKYEPLGRYTKFMETENYRIKNTNSNVFKVSLPTVDLDQFFNENFVNDTIQVRGKVLQWRGMEYYLKK
jgi:hypothetical protein